MAAPAQSFMDFSQEDLALLHLYETALGADSLLEYIPRITPQWEVPWHLRPIADLFIRAEYGPVRACVSVPPRHGKTELLIHAVPWWLSRHPEDTLAYISYSGDFANAKAKRALDLAQRGNLPIRKDIKRASQWRTIADGGMLATGIGGPLTGHGANILIIDDPIKNREEAESPTVRQKTWDWFTSTALTRVEPGGSVIVVHTRWHDDDLIGRLQRDHSDDWEYVNLPAIDEEAGTALWPSRWPRSALDVRRKEVGEYDWWALFQGQPRPRGGRLFKEPTLYEWPKVEDARMLIVCDPAASKSTYSDYSAIIVGAGWLDENGLPRVDILDVVRLQVEIPQLTAMLLEMQRTWQAPVAVEAVGGFKAVPQALRQVAKGLRIIELNATTDKFTRSLPAVAAWNDGRIRVPAKGAKWLPPFLGEVMSFTGVNDAHDDQVDALAHLYSTFAALLPRRGTKRARTPAWAPFG